MVKMILVAQLWQQDIKKNGSLMHVHSFYAEKKNRILSEDFAPLQNA